MSQPGRHQVRMRIRGELDPAWAHVLADLDIAAEPDGTTVLRGELADQAAVHGLLATVRDLGLSIVSLETVSIPGPATARGVPQGSGPSADGGHARRHSSGR